MDVILLERIAKLGQMGETVKVRDGFARNYLLPLGKALRANEANKKRFESERATLEARNLERKSEAQAVAEKLDGKSFVIVRSAGETGHRPGVKDLDARSARRSGRRGKRFEESPDERVGREVGDRCSQPQALPRFDPGESLFDPVSRDRDAAAPERRGHGLRDEQRVSGAAEMVEFHRCALHVPASFVSC